MATSTYLTGRIRYQRPQAILWSENAGTLTNGIYVPNGYEIGADTTGVTNPSLLNQFLILSDHNRSEINFNVERIEQRQRTINGRMRSYHIADKVQYSWSWDRLPSRAYFQTADFDAEGKSPYINQTGEFTADGGAGGVELLEWHKNHSGPFWMYLAYDNYRNFSPTEENPNAQFGHLAQYNEIVQVYFSDFNYSVAKRGGNNYDMWNISVTLEEV